MAVLSTLYETISTFAPALSPVYENATFPFSWITSILVGSYLTLHPFASLRSRNHTKIIYSS
ncbi:hypothetical protein, partial [Butyrivibrio sp. AE3004]|uniref:hypothetical protein n=1 Tax=Butyrivibrio sp. AE3004 TaxID=1506994 RepID=UPI001A9A5C66